jgi:hypothetical protein
VSVASDRVEADLLRQRGAQLGRHQQPPRLTASDAAMAVIVRLLDAALRRKQTAAQKAIYS